MKKLSPEWTERIFYRLRIIYDEDWTKKLRDPKIAEKIFEEWQFGCADMSSDEIKIALDKCRDNLSFVPKVADFRRMGKKVISEEDALQAAVRRDFSDPVVGYAFKKIGAWDFSHDTDLVLRQKFKKAYQEAISSNISHDYCLHLEALYRTPKNATLSLGYDDKNKSSKPPLLGSFLGNNISGKDRIANILKKAQENGQEIDWLGKSCPWWNKDEYEPSRRQFKKSVAIERRNFLLSMTDIAALSRSRDDQIDRFRFIGEREANEVVEKNKREWIANNNSDQQKPTKTWKKDIYD